MLSKKIDRLDELAAKATPGEWAEGEDNDGWYIEPSMGDGNQIAYTIAHDDAQFIAAANPQAVSELIAMLREAQKDAERYHKWRKETAQDNGYSEDYIDQTLDAAMQRDCGGAQHAKDSHD